MRKGNSVNFYLPETFKAEFSKCQWEMEDAFKILQFDFVKFK